MKKNIGWILLVAYYLLFMFTVIISGNITYLIASIFVPVITIPMHIISMMFLNTGSAVIEIVWLGVGFYLISKEN